MRVRTGDTGDAFSGDGSVHIPEPGEKYQVRFHGGPHADSTSTQLSHGGVEAHISRDIEHGARTVWYECTGGVNHFDGTAIWEYAYETTVDHPEDNAGVRADGMVTDRPSCG